MGEFTPRSHPNKPLSIDAESLRLLIRAKLRDGSLPWDSIPRVWGGKAANEVCSACGENIPPEALVMEGIGDKMAAVQFHVGCFHVWDVERRLGGED
jgi:hypothetical protein